MGEIVAVGNGKADGKVDTGERGRDRTDCSRTNSADTNAERTGDTGRTGDTARTGDTGRETEKTVISGLAVLTDDEKKKYAVADDDEKKRILRNAKRREKYANEKKSNGQTVKPRKVNKAKKSEPPIDTAMLNAVISSVSVVIASRPNCEHWLLNETEINSITTPLAKMLAESEQFANIGEYSNQIALVMACVTVFMPRLIISAQKAKETKKIERTGQHTDTNVRNIGEKRNLRTPEKGNHGNDRKHDGQLADHGTEHSQNEPYYGTPLC